MAAAGRSPPATIQGEAHAHQRPARDVRVVSDGDVRVRLPDAATSPRMARRVVADALSGRAEPDVTYTAELLVSEIVTNALRHASPELAGSRQLHLRVTLRLSDRIVRVEVTDPAWRAMSVPAARTVTTPGPLAESGRGLGLVAAYAKEWGVTPHPGGKSVWFELELAP